MKKKEGKEEKLHQQKLVKMLSSDFVSKAFALSTVSQNQTKPDYGSQKCEGILNWFYFHIPVYCQIWLNWIMDDQLFTYITNIFIKEFFLKNLQSFCFKEKTLLLFFSVVQ